jgi:hypothetical protein
MLIGPIAADRRADLRHKVAAEAEVTDCNYRVGMLTRISDLSKRGCFLETSTPFPVNTITKILIRKGTESFEAHARVVSAFSNAGMGLQFTNVDPVQRHILSAWLRASIETSWQSSNRQQSANPGEDSQCGSREWMGLDRRSKKRLIHKQQCPWGIDTAFGECGKGAAARAVERSSRATVDCLVAYVGESRGELVNVAVSVCMVKSISVTLI